MRVLTTTKVKIGRKVFAANTQIDVTTDLARTLIRSGKAHGIDGTFDTMSVVYAAKAIPVLKKTTNKKKTTPKIN
jgi:hypothetical protein